jgi:hypothetical protein
MAGVNCLHHQGDEMPLEIILFVFCYIINRKLFRVNVVDLNVMFHIML